MAHQHISSGMRDGARPRLPRLVSWKVEKDRHAMNPLLSRISVDPNVCFGKPCVRGTRIWVSLLLDFLASGTAMEQILEEYPQLTRDDILAAIAYGAEMSRGRFVDLPGQSAA